MTTCSVPTARLAASMEAGLNQKRSVGARHWKATMDCDERVIENPLSGERIAIRTSGTETGGTLLV